MTLGTADKNALWTPGHGLQVWIPDSARKTTYLCKLCGAGFPEEQKQQWARHVGACAKKHDDSIQAEVKRRDEDILYTPQDKEYFAHLKKNPRNRKRKLKGIAGV